MRQPWHGGPALFLLLLARHATLLVVTTAGTARVAMGCYRSGMFGFTCQTATLAAAAAQGTDWRRCVASNSRPSVALHAKRRGDATSQLANG